MIGKDLLKKVSRGMYSLSCRLCGVTSNLVMIVIELEHTVALTQSEFILIAM